MFEFLGTHSNWLPKLGPPLDAVSETALALKNPYNFIFAPLPSLMSGISPPCFGTSIGKTRNGATAGTTAGADAAPWSTSPDDRAPEFLPLLTGTRYTAATTPPPDAPVLEAFIIPGAPTVKS